MDSLNAAGSIGRSQKGLRSGGLKVENSQSSASLSTNEGSGSGSSPPSDDGSDGATQWQPLATWEKSANGGYAQAPWKPAPAGAPPVWAQVGQPYTGDSLPHWASGPEPGSKANADLELSGAQDAFAALDALADELGPVPEVDVSPKKGRKTANSRVRNARDIAALKNPSMPVTSAPAVSLPAMSSFGSLPSVAPKLTEGAEDLVTSTPRKNQQELPQQFSSALGSLPGPQQFLISDSPQKDDDEHSWDEDVPDADVPVADIIAFAAKGTGEAAHQDDDPWDSEDDEPAPKPQQLGVSEGKDVDHDCWDSEEEIETKAVRRHEEDGGMKELDDLVGEVLDGQRRIPVHELLPDFRCMQCDNSVIRFVGCEWSPDVDYMCVRNFHGKPNKLRPMLNLNSGCTAYCCQCSWKNAVSSETLKAVGEDLRWRSIS